MWSFLVYFPIVIEMDLIRYKAIPIERQNSLKISASIDAFIHVLISTF